MKNLLLTFIILATTVSAEASLSKYKIDDKDTVDGVAMRTGKHKKVRMYEGHNIKEFNAPIKEVMATIMDFEGRCNNEYKKKRRESSKDFKCRHHNKNLVETIRITKLKDSKLEKNETDRFVLQRLIYNRDTFRHYDLVRVFKTKNEKKQTVYRITQRMLSNKEAKKYLDEPFSKESAFIETKGEYIITAVGKNKTIFDYKYTSKTDHWLLNKSIVVGEFFENMSKGINNLFKAISKDTTKTAMNDTSKVKTKN